VGGGRRDENVFRLDVAVEEVVSVDVLEARKDLVKNTLHTSGIQTLVVAGFHQLIKITIHIFHTDMELFAVRVEEDVQGRNEVSMCWQGSQEDDLSEFQAR